LYIPFTPLNSTKVQNISFVKKKSLKYENNTTKVNSDSEVKAKTFSRIQVIYSRNLFRNTFDMISSEISKDEISCIESLALQNVWNVFFFQIFHLLLHNCGTVMVKTSSSFFYQLV